MGEVLLWGGVSMGDPVGDPVVVLWVKPAGDTAGDPVVDHMSEP